MKTGIITKSSSNMATDKELNLINQYTRRKLSSDEIYVFSLVLCDNDIDRDYERFTVESLFALEKLFVGKTGIFDHDVKATNQTARIFECKVEAVDGKKTATGDDYFRLKAKAYIPICDKNRDIIASIDSGIIKEVSVGCAVKKVLCSICKNEVNSTACHHTKGTVYNKELCFGELDSPYDAYEFSFVAVPAQRSAGVIKTFTKDKRKDKKMNDILKSLSQDKDVTLSFTEAKKLYEYIGELEKSAHDGKLYKNQLKKDVIRLSAILQPEIPTSTLKSILEKLTVEELCDLKAAYEKKNSDITPFNAQLSGGKTEKHNEGFFNTQFTI